MPTRNRFEDGAEPVRTALAVCGAGAGVCTCLQLWAGVLPSCVMQQPLVSDQL
jgi:hypothetical protein